ncbi:dTMP kinase [Streptomyces sp. NBC_01260]|uniref:dTMP kinase n=1 Tax=unclassified Streptomyces TaxID=2593676 RepID=UPI000FA3D118|nr:MULTISPECIES: dTMP kinase [unclassified Streptomyces]MCX4771638.1 dTMP kinase [Streptomyces sp. NBC_01285]RPK48402.1 Thymidylate kinase [Streptomyces sp. ADI92-24]
MTRAEQPTVVSPTSDTLAADSRERAVRALLRIPPLKRLWSAQLVGGIGDALALLVLVLLSLQAAVLEGSFGSGYRGAAFAVAAVFGARIISTLLFGAVLLGPLTTLTAPGGPIDRRWLMIGADGLRLALLVVAPLWIDWMPDRALMMILITVFVTGVGERLWRVAKESAAPALLPAPPIEGAAVRPLPDHLDALRRLSLRTDFAAVPVAAAVLLVATLIGNLLGSGLDWFSFHQAALGSYVAAGLFSASISILYFLELPGTATPRPRSPLEGLRRPTTGSGPDKGRTGAVPLIVGTCAAVAGAIAAAGAAAVLHATDLGGGPATLALLILALTGGTGVGIRTAGKVLPALSRRRLLSLATAVTGVALLVMGLVPDTATVVLIAVLAGYAAGVAANTGHVLVDQETEEFRRARTTEHLQAVVRVLIALGAVGGPLLAAAIGTHRLTAGDFVFAHGGAAFTLMLIGALLLPVAAIVLAKTDDRSGVPLRRDLREALRGGDPAVAPAATGFFLALEGGDGAGKSTQVEALAEWIRAKGHEVVVTREPGATPVGKRLRSILLDVSSAGLSNRAEALLYAADRAEHVDSVVRPALERGAIVISDRYIDSSVAYQGAGRDLAPTEIARISRWATSGLVPHLTVLLDVDPETARERFTEAPDRLESEPPEFHARVRSGFLTLAAADPTRYLVVDAGQEPESITTVVRHRLDQLLPLSEAEIKALEAARKAAEEEARRLAEEEAARKAEEERLERERQEQLAKLRAEEEERKRRELEEARRREAERQAEEARQRAEEARRIAEEERARLEAEEAAREVEQARLRRQAEEEARQRREAEAQRLEKQRKAEESLLRAEAARRQAEAEAAEAAETARAEAAAAEAEAAEAEAAARASRSSGSSRASGSSSSSGSSGPDNELTVPTPIVNPNEITQPVPSPGEPSSGATRSRSRSSSATWPSDEAETTMIPKVTDPSERSGGRDATGATDETTVLPPVRDAGRESVRDADPADRVPRGIFRDEHPAGSVPERENERTRELPQVTDPHAPQQPAPDQQERSGRPSRRPRPDWAEETPLDDLPTLADELLGDHDDEGPASSGRGRRPRR